MINEKDLYEQIGRLQMQLAEKQAALESAVTVIWRIRIGEIDPDRIIATPTSFDASFAVVEPAVLQAEEILAQAE